MILTNNYALHLYDPLEKQLKEPQRKRTGEKESKKNSAHTKCNQQRPQCELLSVVKKTHARPMFKFRVTLGYAQKGHIS